MILNAYISIASIQLLFEEERLNPRWAPFVSPMLTKALLFFFLSLSSLSLGHPTAPSRRGSECRAHR
jgi:hypothetical protein